MTQRISISMSIILVIAAYAVGLRAATVGTSGDNAPGDAGSKAVKEKPPVEYRFTRRWLDMPVDIRIVSANQSLVERVIAIVGHDFDKTEPIWDDRSAQQVEQDLLTTLEKNVRDPKLQTRHFGLVFTQEDGVAKEQDKIAKAWNLVRDSDTLPRLEKLFLMPSDALRAKFLRKTGENLLADYAEFSARIDERMKKSGINTTGWRWADYARALKEDRERAGNLFNDKDFSDYNRISKTDIFLTITGLRPLTVPMTAVDDESTARDSAIKQIMHEMRRLRRTRDFLRTMQYYMLIRNRADPDKEISDLVRIARAAPQPVGVDPITAGILSKALAAYRDTDGAFDPTIGTVFGRVNLTDVQDPRLKLLVNDPSRPSKSNLIRAIARSQRISPQQVEGIQLWDLWKKPILMPLLDTRIMIPLSEMPESKQAEIRAEAQAGKITIFTDEDAGDFIVEPVKGAARHLTALIDGGALSVDTSGNTARLAKPGARLTLRFIAGGFMADRIRTILKSKGLINFSVKIGNVIAVGGRPLSGDAWIVSLPNPSMAAVESASIQSPRNKVICILHAPANRLRRDRELMPVINPKTGALEIRNALVITAANSGIAAQTWAYALFQKPMPDAVVALKYAYGVEMAMAHAEGMWVFSENFIRVTGFLPDIFNRPSPEATEEGAEAGGAESDTPASIGWPGLIQSSDLIAPKGVTPIDASFQLWRQFSANPLRSMNSGMEEDDDTLLLKQYGKTFYSSRMKPAPAKR